MTNETLNLIKRTLNGLRLLEKDLHSLIEKDEGDWATQKELFALITKEYEEIGKDIKRVVIDGEKKNSSH